MNIRLAGAAAAAAMACAVHADFVGFESHSYLVTIDSGEYAVIDFYAAFDDPDSVLLNVFNASVVLHGAPAWYQDAAGQWTPQVSLDAADSFLTIGGETGAQNTTSLDPSGACPPSPCGWVNLVPPNQQGIADDTFDGADPTLFYTHVARYSIPVQPTPAFVEFLGTVTYTPTQGTPAQQGFGVAVAYYLCGGGGAPERLLVMLDRTGSLNVDPPGPETFLCDASWTAAQLEILAYSLANPGGLISVWTFNGASPTEQTAGFVGSAQALAALGAADDCTGTTPLAESICAGIDEFLLFCADNASGLRMFLLTDGEENVSDGPCSGPASLVGPPPSGNYTIGSWQQKVYDHVLASGIEVDVWYWEPSAIPPSPGAGPSDLEFLTDLAESSGGYIVHIPFGDVTPPPVGACCMADGTCVDGSTVFDCVEAKGTFQGIGSPCSQCGGGTPSCPADLDGSGTVDGEDLGALLGAWGGAGKFDLDGSGEVDGGDLGAILGAWGDCPPQ